MLQEGLARTPTQPWKGRCGCGSQKVVVVAVDRFLSVRGVLLKVEAEWLDVKLRGCLWSLRERPER